MLSPLKHIPRVEARAAILSLVVGLALLVVKFAAYFLTGSTIIFSDALEGIVNVTAAAFALYSIGYAHQPADEKHPYGHGKVEFFSAGFEGGMILLAAAMILFRAIEAFQHGTQLQHDALVWAIVLTSFALAVNGLLGLNLVRTGRTHRSITLEADGWHLLTDAITSAVALVTIVIIYFTHLNWLDPAAAVVASLYIGRTGLRLMGHAKAGLLDEQDDHDRQTLERILNGHIGPAAQPPRICSYHKLRHRHSGRYHWVDFHLVIPASMSVDQGHRLASTIEYEIEQTLGEGNATAHIEPCIDRACARCRPTHQEPA